MPADTITIIPLAGAMGAEITGVDLQGELSNQIRNDIHQAFLDHRMIYFRDQDLTPERQTEVARIFGKPAIYPFLAGVDGVPEAHEVIKTPEDAVNFGGVWHSDTTYKPIPDMGTLLYACEVPDVGGDTLFTNTTLAYETLSDGMKGMLDGLIAVNHSEKLYPGGRAKRLANLSGMKNAYKEESEPMESEHPVVRTHPETGLKGLYVNDSHTLLFKDMTVDESKPLLDYLCRHAIRPEFTCRLKWLPGTLAVWDNRCTQHYALDDYPGKYRHMRRVTIEGDKPA
ncbi:MAG: taurine dioxygenase [Rhodospirillaceae bacterium]|nr:taurine dioxygenase [Rhodospirillaceae bacterium]